MKKFIPFTGVTLVIEAFENNKFKFSVWFTNDTEMQNSSILVKQFGPKGLSILSANLIALVALIYSFFVKGANVHVHN